MSSNTVGKFGVVGKTSEKHNGSLQQVTNRIGLLKYRYRCSFPCDYFLNLDNDTFAIIITEPRTWKGGHWKMIANSCQILHFADSLGQPTFLN